MDDVRRWVWIAAGVATWTWLRARPFRVEVAGSSMAPLLRSGDWLLAARTARIRRDDVVVLRHPSRQMDVVKRVVAVPGERFGGRELGTNEYLVAGDNREASTDGRAFGPVARGSIEGVVRFRYWPRPALIRRGPLGRGGQLPVELPDLAQGDLDPAAIVQAETKPQQAPPASFLPP